MIHVPSVRLLTLLVFLAAPVAGCGASLIANTDVEDSSENRRVLAFCERYRHAVEAGDVDTLVSMVSPRYFETGGNAKATDDLDYNGLRAYLANYFMRTKSIRYEIRYHRVNETENKIIQIDYTYTASYQIPTTKGDLWHRSVRDNRLQLLRDGDTFKILSGM